MTIQEAIANYKKADRAVAIAFARYNNTASGEKFGALYYREYNSETGEFDGNYEVLTYPIRYFGGTDSSAALYYATEEFPMVYKYNERTGKYRESKTAYKALGACERAIDKALARRDEWQDVIDDYRNRLIRLADIYDPEGERHKIVQLRLQELEQALA